MELEVNIESEGDQFYNNIERIAEYLNNDTDEELLSSTYSSDYQSNFINKNRCTSLFPNFKNLNINKQKALKEHTDKECGICFNDFKLDDNICNLSVCNHLYHQECLEKWYNHCLKDSKNFTCPICRKQSTRA